MTVAALFVRKNNHYSALGLDCYDIDRDALTWQGGCPGIFHPPCRAWGQLSHMAKPRPGESELALWSVEMCRKFGGVIEHPINSRLWKTIGCRPYGIRDDHGGILIPVLQSWFGHRAPKATGLYVVGPVPEFPADLVDESSTVIERMGRAERERTPPAFAKWLVELAMKCEVQHA